jgi:hypothetical protein
MTKTFAQSLHVFDTKKKSMSSLCYAPDFSGTLVTFLY